MRRSEELQSEEEVAGLEEGRDGSAKQAVHRLLMGRLQDSLSGALGLADKRDGDERLKRIMDCMDELHRQAEATEQYRFSDADLLAGAADIQTFLARCAEVEEEGKEDDAKTHLARLLAIEAYFRCT